MFHHIKPNSPEFHDIEHFKGIVTSVWSDDEYDSLIGTQLTLNKDRILNYLYCDNIYIFYNGLSQIRVEFVGYWLPDMPILEIDLREVRCNSDITFRTRNDILDYFEPDRESDMVQEELTRKCIQTTHHSIARMKKRNRQAINKTKNT